ncbi:hypothetical protein [Frankia sp. QA3]|uniref:hypothetical protein n=1 Tax=Frankia sp. QA3 TaxID=710111 RepID=UPI000269C8AD|nr:hypothetical protein [Frankia sp. QA3]EIV94609.1 adenylate kinase-like kinase [Frankia sp. QA3]
MRRIVILGRGGAGKSTLARRLGEITAIPVIELDQLFWRPGPRPSLPQEWAQTEREAVRADAWIMDGDLGPYEVSVDRFAAADAIVVLDFSLPRCAWRALRRSRENLEFWRWTIGYRRRSLPQVMARISARGAAAELHVVRNPRELERFVALVAATAGRGTTSAS